MSNCKEIFTDIYRRKVWGDGSGGGSGEQALPYCRFITTLLAQSPNIRTVLDIGCGDGVVARNIQWGSAKYIGVDASGGWVGPMGAPPPNVIQNFDALTDPLPDADLLLCKEVLQHLSNAQVQALLDRTAHYPLRLFTSMTGPGTNMDIATGDSRPVDLSAAPFNLPCTTVLSYGKGATWIVQQLAR